MFLLEYPVRQIVFAREAQEAAVSAFAFEEGAGVGMVADGGTLPHIVQGPDNGLARFKDFLYVVQ